MIDLHPDAFALRPARIKGEKIILYTASTFPKNPWGGCWQMLTRAFLSGKPKQDETDLIVDVLNKDGDIIQDFGITKKGFEYLRRTLKFRVEK